MSGPNTRKPMLTPEQTAELNRTGHVDNVTLEKAPWYQPLLEHAVKVLWIACAGMGLFILNGYNDGQHEQASATKELAHSMNGLQNELTRQSEQIKGLVETMRGLSQRQDLAIATAERASADQQALRSRVELLQYYVLEFDGKLISTGIVQPKDSVALKLRKREERDQ